MSAVFGKVGRIITGAGCGADAPFVGSAPRRVGGGGDRLAGAAQERCLAFWENKNPAALAQSGYGGGPIFRRNHGLCGDTSAHSFHEAQLDHTRRQASWLMADNDAPPPSHPSENGQWQEPGTDGQSPLEGVSPITVAGPHRIYTGFPFQLARSHEYATANEPPAGADGFDC